MTSPTFTSQSNKAYYRNQFIPSKLSFTLWANTATSRYLQVMSNSPDPSIEKAADQKAIGSDSTKRQ